MDCQCCGEPIKGRPKNDPSGLCKPCEKALALSTCAVCTPVRPGVQFCWYCQPRGTALKRAAERFHAGHAP